MAESACRAEGAGPVLSGSAGDYRVRRSPSPPGAPTRAVLVQLCLFAGLERYAPAPLPLDVAVEEGLTVGDLLDALRVPASEAKLLFVNHRTAEREQTLRDGDRVGAFPQIAGG